MKQGKLIRRAVSAALAGCMMFTLSAPALAESTDALMQLSMTRRSAVSVLDAENGDTANYGFTIDLNGTTKTVNESNCKDIFEDKKLSYDPITNKLTNKDTISGELTIDAPNVDVELTGNSFVIYGSNSNLNIKNARNVTLSTNSFSVVGGLYSGNAEINCSGKLTIKNSDPSWSAIQDNLTVHNALEILVEGRFSTVVGGDVKIECACPATFFKKNQNGRIAQSITYAGDYGYYTDDTADTAIDPNVMPIPVETAKYVRIAPKMRYNINTAEDAAIKLQGQNTERKTAFAGEKVTVTAAGRENAEFTGWTAEGITLTDDQKANPTVTFTMPGNNVTLIPNYNVVQDFGIYVDDKPVTSENYQNLKSGRIVYDPVQKTLTAANRIKNLLKVRAPETDVILNGGIGRGDLTIGQQDYPSVVGADDVTVTSDQYAAIDGWVYINCTGKVDIRSNEDVAVNGNLNIYDSSEMILSADSSAVTGSANITSKGDVTIESTDGRAAKNLTINKAENVTITISDDERAVSENTDITASGTVILKNNAPGGHVGTVDFTQADGKKYVYYTSEAEDAKLIDYYDSEVVANDELLTRYLAKNKKAVLGEIIATIQQEQNEIIRKSPYHSMIVQGVAGSGKTTVAMHRISYILYNYEERFQPEDFYIVGSNRILLDYITGVLPDLDVYGIRQMTMEQLFVRLLYEDWDETYRICPVRDAGKDGAVRGTLAWFEKLQKFCSRVEWNTIPRTTVLFNRKQFVEGLRDGRVGVFDESGGKNDPKDMVVLMTGEAIERYIRQNPSVSAQSKVLMLQERLMGKVEDEFLGKGISYTLEEKKAIRRSMRKRFGARQWKKSVYEMYHDFLTEQKQQGVCVEEPQEELDVYDLAALAYLYRRMRETEVISEAHHIVVDEAQDFGVMVYAVLKECVRSCTYTVMGDVSQNIRMDYGISDWEGVKNILLTGERDNFCVLRRAIEIP